MLTYDLRSAGTGPMYLRLYMLIREDIRRGVLPPGSKLPSKRTLAEHLGVSVITVDGAYGLLMDEGYVRGRERSGCFVSPIAPMPAGGAGEGTGELTRLPETPGGGGEGTGFRYSALTKIMRQVITDYGGRLLEKPPALGCAELRNAIGEYLLRYRGMRAQPERIVIGSGAEHLYGMLVQLLGRDKLYAIEDPGYEKIRLVYNACGAQCLLLPLDGDGVASDALRDCQADVLHVTPYHSFPTGITATTEKRLEYLAWASRGDRLIIEDDFDSEFALTRKPQEPLYAMDREERVIYLNTFSHSLAPSMRMGYMILPPRLLEEYRRRLGFYSCTVPLLDQYVLARFIDQGHFERHLNRVRRKLRGDARED